jgi:hypothetical protein
VQPENVCEANNPLVSKRRMADGARRLLACVRGSRTRAPEFFREPVKDERFVVFARPAPGSAGPPPPSPGEPVLQWTGSQQSLLEIGAGGAVTSRGPKGPFAQAVDGLLVEELGRRVRALAK